LHSTIANTGELYSLFLVIRGAYFDFFDDIELSQSLMTYIELMDAGEATLMASVIPNGSLPGSAEWV